MASSLMFGLRFSLRVLFGIGIALSVGGVPVKAAQSPARGIDPIMQVPVISMSLARLPKWSALLDRHRQQIRSGSGEWALAIADLSDNGGNDLVSAVNSYVNRARYLPDSSNWGSIDHWATPTDILARGGDCEDYAIAKYLLLRDFGVPESQMRVLILRATEGIPDHAVLLVQTSNGMMVLDNLRSRPYRYSSRVASAASYGFNQSGMWLSLAGLSVR